MIQTKENCSRASLVLLFQKHATRNVNVSARTCRCRFVSIRLRSSNLHALMSHNMRFHLLQVEEATAVLEIAKQDEARAKEEWNAAKVCHVSPRLA